MTRQTTPVAQTPLTEAPTPAYASPGPSSLPLPGESAHAAPGRLDLAPGAPQGGPSRQTGKLPPARSRRKALPLLVLLVGLLVASAGGMAWYKVANSPSERTDLITHTVRREPLRVTVVERGTLESATNQDIVVRVKAKTQGSQVATTIKWVIDDGARVKKGDLLAELDDSALQETLKTQKIAVEQANAAWLQAEEEYKIVESQNQTDVKTAEIAKELAEIDLEKFLKGDYQQQKKDIEGRIKIADY
jgi:HlyD family secretion protein